MKIGIFHPTDPAGHVPGGIDTFIRGIMRWAPPDLEYVLFGATSDPVARPVGRQIEIPIAGTTLRYIPVVAADAAGRRGRIPLTVRYLAGLRRAVSSGLLADLDAMDFHRIETALAFHRDPRPRNLFIHQDMAVLREPGCDIGWRRAPWLYERLEALAFSRLSRVFCVRQSAVDRYRESFPAWEDRFSFIPTWVETGTFRALDPGSKTQQRLAVARELGVDPAGSWVISVGRLDRQKDPLLMVDAFAGVRQQLPNTRLLMIGDGILRAEVEQRIVSRDVADSVTLTGALPAAKIAQLLAVSDVFFLSSVYEGMPIVVLEALASGIPVVTTDVGEVKRAVNDGVNGAVVTRREAGTLAAALVHTLLTSDDQTREACIRAAAAYTPGTVLGRIYDNHRSELGMLPA